MVLMLPPPLTLNREVLLLISKSILPPFLLVLGTKLRSYTLLALLRLLRFLLIMLLGPASLLTFRVLPLDLFLLLYLPMLSPPRTFPSGKLLRLSWW
ncbi:hypothetical protein Hdeb2414_s0017g00508201 [Helianthus debilis subsp. tardiflorus]